MTIIKASLDDVFQKGRKSPYPDWAMDPALADEVPTFADLGITANQVVNMTDDVVEWYAMREQLWAIREGLA